MIDFTGGALKKKRKQNIFADVVERRKDEGNYLKMFLPGRSRGEPTGKLKWIRVVLLALVLVLGAVMIYLMLFTPRVPGPGARSLPRDGGPVGVRPAKAGPSGKTETSPPVKRDPTVREIVDRGTVKFHPPRPKFKPLTELDPDVLADAWDTDMVLKNTPWVAHNIKAEHEIVAHIYRFLRTHPAEVLSARADPKLTHRDMMTDQDHYRGRVVNMRVMVLRKYKIYGWPESDSGVPDTTMLFVRNATPGRNPYIFVVLVAQPPGRFRERDLYQFTGVFMKRFPYQRKDNKWETHPLLLTMKMEPAAVTTQDSIHVTVAVVIVAVVLMIVLYFAVRGETRESAEKRSERLERRRVGRSRLKQQLESARLKAGNEEEPGSQAGAESPDPSASAGSKDEGEDEAGAAEKTDDS